MTEYVRRDELKDRMADFVPLFIDESNRAYVDGLTDAYTLICQAPAADVVVRKTGKWLKSTWSIRCSECGYDMPFAVRNFCPNCGAQMIGGDDDEEPPKEET